VFNIAVCELAGHLPTYSQSLTASVCLSQTHLSLFLSLCISTSVCLWLRVAGRQLFVGAVIVKCLDRRASGRPLCYNALADQGRGDTSPYLCNPSSFRQPYSVHCPPSHPAHITSSQSPHSLPPSITSSVFHSRLKTHLFHKSFPPFELPLRILNLDHTYLLTCFLHVLHVFLDVTYMFTGENFNKFLSRNSLLYIPVITRKPS